MSFISEAFMKIFKFCVVLLLATSMAYAMPLNSSARAVVPADLLQLISVDYRALKDSTTAMTLRDQLLPDNIKQFEAALKGIGINPDKDVDTLAFISFHTNKQGVKNVGVASGPFDMKAVLKKMKLQKFTPKKYGTALLYPMDGGMTMSFLDDSTLLFGELGSVKMALDVRDGQSLSIDTNANMSDMMSTVDASPVWSILDQLGTQNAMRSALGDASKLTDYDSLKKRFLGSYYTMNFTSGVNFDATIVTSDSVTAGTLSSVMKGFVLFKKTGAPAGEKVAWDNTAVDSDSSNVIIHFKSNDQQFQALMHTDLFTALSH
jgi:hypothetical protein